MTINTTIQALKENEQDFEWYPTTDEMIEAVKQDCFKEFTYGDDDRTSMDSYFSLLDIGAGDGRVLRTFDTLKTTDDRQLPLCEKKYAIEKSQILATNYDRDIYLISSDFLETNLIDKEVGVIFCNPPYSQFELWTSKIITEANADLIYLIIPERYKNSKEIAGAIKARQIQAENISTLGKFDFLDADRSARAKVEIVKIKLRKTIKDGYKSNFKESKSAFDTFFDENINSKQHYEHDYERERNSWNEELKKADFEKEFNDFKKQRNLVNGNYIEALVKMYEYKIKNLINSYKALCSIDDDIFSELKLDLKSIKEALKLKIKSTKLKFWHELFDRYEPITLRLTSASRQKLFDRLISDGAFLDFNAKNIYNVTIWAIKSANLYLNEQIVDFYYQLTQPENIKLYKSNERFVNDKWKYIMQEGTYREWNNRGKFDRNKAFCLDYRIVLPYGYTDKRWSGDLEISNRGLDLLNDFRVIANNLGLKPMNLEWGYNSKNISAGIKNYWSYVDKNPYFLEYKAFKNGNMHFKLDKEFLALLNVKVSQILKWCKSPQEASSEIDGVDEVLATRAFNANAEFLLTNANMLLSGK